MRQLLAGVIEGLGWSICIVGVFYMTLLLLTGGCDRTEAEAMDEFLKPTMSFDKSINTGVVLKPGMEPEPVVCGEPIACSELWTLYTEVCVQTWEDSGAIVVPERDWEGHRDGGHD